MRLGRLVRQVQEALRQHAEQGRLVVIPGILLALFGYAVIMAVYLVPADPRIWITPADYVAVVAKVLLAGGTVLGLCLVWLRAKPVKRILRVYDWLGGGLLALAVLWAGSLGRDVIDPRYLGDIGRWVIGATTGLWGALGSLLLIVGTANLSNQLRAERRERERLEALIEFTRRITSLDYRVIQYEAVQHLHRLLGADATVLYLWDEESQVLVPTAQVHDRSVYSTDYIDRIMSFRCPLGFGLTGWVMQTGEPYLSGDVVSDPRSQPVPGYGKAEKSSLLAPLKVEGHKLGIVRLTRDGFNQFDEDDLDLVLSFANQAALVIEHGRIIKELSDLSITDPLTGLFNARHFHQVLDQEVHRSQRYEQPVSLIMTDSDSLKKVNDLMGHQNGDEHLRQIGRALKSAVRLTDYAFRYAGDEFMLLLPNTGPDEAEVVGERIRQMMDSEEMSEGIRTTVSVGVATLPIHAPDAEGLLAAADWAMYQSKRAGKNRVTLASPEWSSQNLLVKDGG